MRIYYEAFGFFPRLQTMVTGRNELCRWARAIGPGGFQRRQGSARARWETPYRSNDGNTNYTEQTLLHPFMQMGIRYITTGWVQTRHRIGQSRHETIDVWWVDMIRCLPVENARMRQWGYQERSSREWQLIRGYNRQYNQTILARLLSHQPPSEAHRQAVRDMHRQAVNLIFEFAMELASPANVPTGSLLRSRQ